MTKLKFCLNIFSNFEMLYKIVIDSGFIAYTRSSEEWVSYRYLYSHSSQFGGFKWLLVFVMEFWESTFTLEHKHLFCWLISLVWGIAKNARFSKSKVLRIIFVCNLYREMRCFISKDCGVKTCLFFGKCVYGKSYQFTVK